MIVECMPWDLDPSLPDAAWDTDLGEFTRPTSTFTMAEFRAAFRQHPGGVVVLTAWSASGPVALTATSLTSVSADPPLVAFSVSDSSSSAYGLTGADTIVIHFIDTETLHLAKLAATHGVDRFEDLRLWRLLETGEPVYHGTRWLRVRVVNRVRAGTATLVVGEAVESNLPPDEADCQVAPDGLAYLNRHFYQLTDDSKVR